MRGIFIVFEGGEGVGKTTQITYTHQWLQEILGQKTPILVTREPGGTELGQHLRQLLLQENSGKEKGTNSVNYTLDDRTELLLYAADRAQHVAEHLKPVLDQGGIILCDRYTDSTIAYQGYGRGLDLELIYTLNHIATGGLQSDLTLWLDVEVQQGLQRAQKRGKRDRIEQNDLAFHQRVYQGFATLAQQHPQRIIPINGNLPPEAVHERIKRVVKEHLPQPG